MAIAQDGFEGRIQGYFDDPIFRLRVSLLGAHVSWTESGDMTRAEMVAVARVWNDLQEDANKNPGNSGPTERGPELNAGMSPFS